MTNLIERHGQKIVGVVSCFDSLVLQGTLPSVAYPHAMATELDRRDIRLFDYAKQFAQPFRDAVRAHTERVAAEEGVAIEYIQRMKSFRKENRIQQILAERGHRPGLVHIFSAMEPCPTYEPWHDKRTGNTFIRRDHGRCLHYYFYFIDEMLGLCFLAVPTWCPFRALFYLNGHNWLASKLRSANISYELQDNAFAAIEDWGKAQQLSDRLRVKQLHTRLDAAVARYLPDLKPLGRYHWSILQAEYATDIVFRSAADLAPLYDHLSRTAIHAVKVEDVATFLGRSPGRIGERETGGDFSFVITVCASRGRASAITSDLPPSRCTTSTASFFASRPRRTMSLSSDTTEWWNSATVSGSSSSLPSESRSTRSLPTWRPSLVQPTTATFSNWLLSILGIHSRSGRGQSAALRRTRSRCRYRVHLPG